MSNKQSSVEFFLYEMFSLLGEFENKALPSYKIMDLFEQAKAMHKEECIKYYVDSVDYGDMGQHIRESLIQIAEKMYNETFGGNND